jgi:hypothetical protein
MRPTRSRLFHVLLACWTVACASRSVPSNEPRTSAASLEAAEAPPHAVTQALDEHPPLPGPESESWLGLRAPAAAGGGHQHQHQQPPAPEAPASGHQQPSAPEAPASGHQHGTPPAHQHGEAPGAPGRNEAAPSGVSYTCPMHPEVVSSEPGRCPRCGMPLVQRR